MASHQQLRNTVLKNGKDESGSLREKYRNNPIQLLTAVDDDMKFPKKIREVFAHIWKRKNAKGQYCDRFIMKACRGGGKSKLLGAMGFCIWYLEHLDVVDMGGSMAQAQGVYNYFAGHVTAHPAILKELPKDPTMNLTKTKEGNYFKAIPASPKAVRGPHPDILMGDEICEAKDELVLAAMPMVDTSEDSMIILASTFHKIFGIFQETWDKADELGYMRLSWDIFDVAREFDHKFLTDPELLKEIPDLTIAQRGKNSLEYRMAGRVGDPEGWVPFRNILQAWREKESLDYFDVEYMGNRPSASGMVLDPIDVEAQIYTPDMIPVWELGAESVLGVDWGFSSMTACVELMKHIDMKKAMLWNKNWSNTGVDVIIDALIERVKLHWIKVIYADSAGKFENDLLRKRLVEELAKDPDYKNHTCRVVEVVFSVRKAYMVGSLRAHSQRRLLMLPETEKEAIWQFKRYQYQEGTDKPRKKDDHIPDATQCALEHFPLKIDEKGFDELYKNDVDKSSGESIASSLFKEDF